MGFLEDEELAELAGRMASDVDGGLIDEEVSDKRSLDDDSLRLRGIITDEEAELDEEDLAIYRIGDPNNLREYWTQGKGLAKWRFHPHPWTRLRNLLRKYPGIRDPEGTASQWFHLVFGYWPGDRKGKNPVGPG